MTIGAICKHNVITVRANDTAHHATNLTRIITLGNVLSLLAQALSTVSKQLEHELKNETEQRRQYRKSTT